MRPGRSLLRRMRPSRRRNRIRVRHAPTRWSSPWCSIKAHPGPYRSSIARPNLRQSLPSKAKDGSSSFLEDSVGSGFHFGSNRILLLLHTPMCNNLHMPTNLAIDDKLIEEARKTGGHRTKKEAVTTALQEYIQRHKQQKILAAFGTFDFDPTYDYKAERRRKRG